MKTYQVFRRKGETVTVEAYSYTEDKRSKRFYFHRNQSKQDKECFFAVSDVAGIIVSSEIRPRVTPESIAEMIRKAQQT